MSTVEGLELALASAESTIDELRSHLRGLSEENSQLCKKVEFQKAAWTQEHEELASLKQQLAEAKKDAELYRTLLDAVENKWPEKTRHEIALMYIKRAEAGTLTGVANAMREGE